MSLRDLTRLVFSNLARMRGRVFMTALGVLIGTMAIVVLIALASGLQQSLEQSFSEFGPVNQITVIPGAGMRMFGVSSSNENAVLTAAKLDEFADLPGVEAVTPVIQVNAGMVKLNRLQGFASLTGIDATQVRNIGVEMAQGSNRLGNWTVIAGARVNENFADPRSRSTEAVEPPDLYGQTLILELTRFDESGDQVSRTIRLRVGGVLDERGGQDDQTLFMSLEDAEEINQWMSGKRIDRNRDGYDQAIIVINDPDLLFDAEEWLNDEGFFAFSARSQLEGISLFFTIVQAVFGGIGAIALLVAAIGIANTMVMSVLERTREIGLMKAVGATNRDVMSVFLAEASTIGFIGGIGGVILGALVSYGINFLAQAYINAQIAASGGDVGDPINIVYIPIWLPIFSILFSMLIGLLAGIYPAIRAVQLNPVTALKYE